MSLDILFDLTICECHFNVFRYEKIDIDHF